MWRETYDEALTAAASGSCAAETLLSAVAERVAINAGNSLATNAHLAAIGGELRRPLSDVFAIDSKASRSERLSVFKLQLVSRLLLLANGSDTLTKEKEQTSVRRPSEAKNKKRTRKKAQVNKKKAKKSKSNAMDMHGELRELLDRIALLIDSANPPSIAESDDEPSPFHAFLLNTLEMRLGAVIPQVFAFLRDEYELAEEEQQYIDIPMPSTAFDPKVMTPVKPESALVSSSILSALKDERPSKKRSLAATSDAFKEVNLPGQLSKATPIKRPTNSDPRYPPRKSGSAPPRSSKRHVPETSLVSLAAASIKAKPGRGINALSSAMPTLLRNVDRQMLTFRGPGSAAKMSHTAPAPKPSIPLRGAPSARPSAAQLSRMSVVMRTPDRPQRLQRSQPRILVEASPPLRIPFATKRLRRPGSQLP